MSEHQQQCTKLNCYHLHTAIEMCTVYKFYYNYKSQNDEKEFQQQKQK